MSHCSVRLARTCINVQTLIMDFSQQHSRFLKVYSSPSYVGDNHSCPVPSLHLTVDKHIPFNVLGVLRLQHTWIFLPFHSSFSTRGCLSSSVAINFWLFSTWGCSKSSNGSNIWFGFTATETSINQWQQPPMSGAVAVRWKASGACCVDASEQSCSMLVNHLFTGGTTYVNTQNKPR